MIWIWRFVEHRLSILIVIVCLLYRNLNFCSSLDDEGLVLLRFEDRVIDPFGNSSIWIQDIRIRDPYSSFDVQGWDRDVVLNNAKTGIASHRKLLQKPDADPHIEGTKSSVTAHSPLLSQSYSPSPSPSPKASASSSFSSPSLRSNAPDYPPSPSPEPFNTPSPDASPHSLINPLSSSIAEIPDIPVKSSTSNNHRALIMSAAIGGPLLIFSLAIGMFFCRGKKIVSVRPWATGLSGQLQKALVTGVPKLKRSELEAACEDFSNVIGSSSVGTVYKGTLSSGVEIAVVSIAETSAHNWSHNLETQFTDKISSLSKVNHKNFVNLLGYCNEDGPFTRMLVFEYAPNGTLFEHLHIKEAEHLEWGMRMRIMMGIAYCLDHMHQLKPPIAHTNLNSSSVNLTEDYASKVSDFVFLNKVAAAEIDSHLESNVYSFGVILFEIVTGRLHYSVDSGSIEDWTSDYMRGNRSLRDMVDPTLKSFQEEQIEPIYEVIKSCVNPNPKGRPQMREVSTRLREITAIGPDGAVPKLSPLWWAELEILSIEACR